MPILSTKMVSQAARTRDAQKEPWIPHPYSPKRHDPTRPFISVIWPSACIGVGIPGTVRLLHFDRVKPRCFLSLVKINIF